VYSVVVVMVLVVMEEGPGKTWMSPVRDERTSGGLDAPVSVVVPISEALAWLPVVNDLLLYGGSEAEDPPETRKPRRCRWV
jgi:hypothetical protein